MPQNLKPAELVARAMTHSKASFVKAVDAPLLLVRIDDAQGDLALTLEAALEEGSIDAGRRLQPSLGFDTVVGGSADRMRWMGAAGGASPSFPIVRASFGGADLVRRLGRLVHFAVTLHKRRGATNLFIDRISVGRAHTNDVVLRHHSVSKFHGWFECDDDGRFYVSDAKSTNATFVNGVDVAETSPHAVAPGDEVRFGDIVTVFCTSAILWDALMVTPPSSRRRAP